MYPEGNLDPSCTLDGEAGVPNPKAGTPCKGMPYPVAQGRKKITARPHPIYEPQRVSGRKSEPKWVRQTSLEAYRMKRRERVTRRPVLPAKFNLTKRKEGGNLPPTLIETRPRRVPRSKSDQRGSVYGPWLCPEKGGRNDKPGGWHSL